MKLSTKVYAGIAAVTLIAGGSAAAVALESGSSSPRSVDVLMPSAATGTTTTIPDFSTTTSSTVGSAASPPITAAAAPVTSATSSPTTFSPAPATTTTTSLDPNVTVPNVVGMTYGQATSTLAATDLQIAPGATCDHTPNGDADMSAVVTSQSLPPGSQLARGDQVSVDC